MHRFSWDELSLTSAICIALHVMDLVSLVLYASLSNDGLGFPNAIYTTLYGIDLVSSLLYSPLSNDG
jgi:hypothetical protein